MDNLNIDLGIKRLMINDDPEKVLEFNPSDIVFAERFYRLIQVVQEKEIEFTAKAEAMEDVEGKDLLPNNFLEQTALMREVCDFVKEEIDILFGEGTSQMLFGDAETLYMFETFFEGITPFMKHARDEKVRKYTKKPKKKASTKS